MRKLFTYLLAAGLFLICVLSYDLIPQNFTDRLLGAVKRNLKKERQELFLDMKEVTKQGLIYFEVYDEQDQLMITLKKPTDFNESVWKKMEEINFRVRSFSTIKLLTPIPLATPL